MDKTKTRCADCTELEIKKGVWTCRECFNQKCSEIDDCPLGITAEEIEAIETHAKENKVKIVASAEDKPKRKAPTRKPDVEKENLIIQLADFCKTCTTNVNITNKSKLIEFDIGENHYTLNLIHNRAKK